MFRPFPFSIRMSLSVSILGEWREGREGGRSGLKSQVCPILAKRLERQVISLSMSHFLPCKTGGHTSTCQTLGIQ